jgi:hypothetical protein
MAHFTFTRGGGVWNPGTPVLASELADIDSKTERAVNGDGGGVWAPASQIEIGGAGLKVSGTELYVTSPATFTGLVTMTDELQCDGDVTLGNTGGDQVACNAEFDCIGPALFFSNVTVGEDDTDTLTVNATASFNEGVTLGSTAVDTLTVNATATFNNGVTLGSSSADAISVPGTLGVADVNFASGTVDFAASMAYLLKCRIAPSGAGRLALRTFAMTDANSTTRGSADDDLVYVPAGVLSADRTYQIDDTGAANGDAMEFSNLLDAANNLVVKDPSGTILVTLNGTAGQNQWARAARLGGFWRVLGVASI